MSDYDRARWLSLLRRPFPPAERHRFLAEIQDLEGRLERLTPNPTSGAALTQARLEGSQSLRGGVRTREHRERLDAWIRANAMMTDFVREDAHVTMDRVRILSGVLQGLEGPAPLRTKRTAVGRFGCVPPEDIEPLLAPMLDVVEERTKEVHPIAGAALLEQWLVTAHPFDDGNGRTSRLASDWALAVAGYPPASYPTLVSSLKAIVDHGGPPISVEETARVLLRGIEHTVALVSAATSAS